MNTLEKIGKWWFKHRGESPLPLLLFVLLWPVTVSVGTWFQGLILILCGEAIRMWSVGYAGGITRTRTGDLNKLVTKGPFKYTRNPIYIGNIIMYLGVGITLSSYKLLWLVFLYFAIQYTLIVRYEENILLDSFGPEYELYRTKVPRWIPNFASTIEESGHQFNIKETLYNERRTLTAIFVILVISIVKRMI